ncbi:hypothetical protein ANAPH1_00672 [Anaplasma phagocytophilum]|nr:hypothetical protein ANAPH1_00313 [Anaplasma phagocytophilum]SCV64787.1 hypothetical protein ANAPH1_00672 [Anaplasma phagocytophilum]
MLCALKKRMNAGIVASCSCVRPTCVYSGTGQLFESSYMHCFLYAVIVF